MSRGARLGALAAGLRGHSGGPGFANRVAAVPGMLLAAFTGRWAAASRGRLLLALLGLVYVVSPLDVVPDVLLPFGLVDDAAIAAASVAYLLASVDRWRAPDAPSTLAAPANEVVPGVVIERSTPPES